MKSSNHNIHLPEPSSPVKGRFAPSPTGRMHLGNLYTALISWLSAKSKGGKWILRIEDLDTSRSRTEYAIQIEKDLQDFGLCWDEGGLDDIGPEAPYSQSRRTDIYAHYLPKLAHITYPCHCRRADIMATQAPHLSDGRVIYPGTCRPAKFPALPSPTPAATRICVPDETISFTDRTYGPQQVNLARECGDFIIRRADGAFAYQLAVVIDDALMGVTEVIRGSDLLLSAAQQIFLHRALGFTPPEYAHVPLLYSSLTGARLSKRDKSISLDTLLRTYTPKEIIGKIAYYTGLQTDDSPTTPTELLNTYTPTLIPSTEKIIIPTTL